MNKNESCIGLLIKAFLTIVAIPIGFMLALITETSKRKW